MYMVSARVGANGSGRQNGEPATSKRWRLTLTLDATPLILVVIACAQSIAVPQRKPRHRRGLVASRLTALPKETGVGNNQEDAYAVRRAELDTQFHALPPVGTPENWRSIQNTPALQSRPLDVVTRCCRVRL